MHSTDAYMDELLDEALSGFDDVDAFTIRTVLRGRDPRRFRVGPGPIPPRMARRLVTNPGRGVFLDGARREVALAWAYAVIGTIPGARVVEDPLGAHGPSLPHFHIDIPGRGRMAHIFYGRAPTRDFFDR